MLRKLVTATFLVALFCVPAVGMPDEIHVSADLGPLVGGPGLSINTAQLVGSRFTISEATQVTAIGGHMLVFQKTTNNGLIFGAIIALSGPGALPEGKVANPTTLADAFSTSELVAQTTFNAGGSLSDFRVPLSATLAPGEYALVFGSGLFGADANGILRNNNTDRPGSSYFFWSSFGSWADDATAAGLRFVVEGAPANSDPVADAGADQVLECTSAAGALVTLAGSATDPEGDALTFAWDVPAGVSLDDPTSSAPTGVFPIGVTTATLTVTDGSGGLDVDDVVISIEDTTPPEVACTTDVAALWPPNHDLVTVEIFIDATDACTLPEDLVLVSATISSNEPDDGLGDGDTVGDVNGLDGYTAGVDVTSSLSFNALSGSFEGSVQLRAERDGGGAGRAYTLEALMLDTGGNLTSTSCVVVVPHDRRKPR